MKMSKKELKARLVTVGKEAQDKSGEELTALMDEAKTIGEILDEIKAREELARAAAAAATEGEEPEGDTKGGEGAETKDKARAESGKALKNGKAVKFKAKAIATKITFQATYKNVLTYLSKIARYCELGFRVVPDFKGKKMTFETYKGIDRTTKQGTKPRVIFSESYNNLNRAKHTYSDKTAKTKIVVGGAGDGADRIYVTVGGGTGFDLREEFLDAKDINKDDFSTNAEYLEALRIRGEQYKAENAVIENIEAEVEAEVNFIYGTDYDLGDIVTVEKAKWNKVLNLRITELCEVYEYGGMYVVPTFGDALPTTINWDN